MWRRVSDCVLWDGPVTPQGYGRIGRTQLAHREAWKRQRGPIPSGMVIHHRCRNKLCVNVDHLECLTHAEHNALHVNAASWHERQRSKTHCPAGHEYTPENTRIKRGARCCRECMRAQYRDYYQRNRERLLPLMRERTRLWNERRKQSTA